MPDNRFFEQPLLNSPYEYPTQHWELDETGQPTHEIIGKRRPGRWPIIAPARFDRRNGSMETIVRGAVRLGGVSASLDVSHFGRTLNQLHGVVLPVHTESR